ncbi:acyl-CoA N-acyltransferase [Chytriomyces sp. MP71]|nr:acyl-CoA N-acyltransferase [Chytriomyces sp. MP71]
MTTQGSGLPKRNRDTMVVRKLVTASDALASVKLVSLAYTGFKLYLDQKVLERAKAVMKRADLDYMDTFGLFDSVSDFAVHNDVAPAVGAGSDDVDFSTVTPTNGLVAQWVQYTWRMNLFGTLCPVGGLGGVATHHLHKKQGLAKILVMEYLDECDRRNQAIATLYPFRTDFYAKMGFASASPYYDYVIRPSSLPLALVASNHRIDVLMHNLAEPDANEMLACYARYVLQHHGAIEKKVEAFDGIWKSKGEIRAYGYRDPETNELQGFLIYEFLSTDMSKFVNDLKIIDLVCENPTALSTFLTFLRLQDDQIRFVRYSTPDAEFHRVLESAFHDAEGFQRDNAGGSGGVMSALASTYLGFMFRVVNIEKLFGGYLQHRNFNNVTAKVLFRVKDTLTPEKNPVVLVAFTAGVVSSVEHIVDGHAISADVIQLVTDVSSFSAVVVGAANLSTFLRYGKAVVTPAHKQRTLEQLFRVDEAPINYVFF